MNEEKIKRFMIDEVMNKSVYNFIRDVYLKGKGQRDIQILAAERLAVDKLDEAWKELERFKSKEENLSTPLKQVGL